MQAGMELAVRAQVKISFYFEVSETVLCFWDISGLNPFPCFFERHETCDREQSERHRAQLRRHIHGQLLCVRPARSFTWGNNPGQTRQNHCLCELERSDIIVTLFQHKFPSSNALFEGKCLLFCFFSGSGHTDRKESDDIHIHGGEYHCICRWPLVVSGESQTLSGGERIHGDCQR